MEKDLSNIENNDGSIIRDLLWSALKDGARREKIDFPYDKYDVGDMMEDKKVIDAFVKVMSESYADNPIPNDESIGEKKT
jgi:hypothetical protein